MSNMRIRNMFLLVTALAVMFLLACGETVVEDSEDELAMYTFANCDELAQVFVAGTPGLTRLVVGSVRTNLNNNDVMRCSAKGVFTFTTTTWSLKLLFFANQESNANLSSRIFILQKQHFWLTSRPHHTFNATDASLPLLSTLEQLPIRLLLFF